MPIGVAARFTFPSGAADISPKRPVRFPQGSRVSSPQGRGGAERRSGATPRAGGGIRDPRRVRRAGPSRLWPHGNLARRVADHQGILGELAVTRHLFSCRAERWRDVTVAVLLADVPVSMPCKQTCHACLGSGHAQTTHPVEVVIQTAHTTTEWFPSVGSEGGREVTVHHPELRRTQWVPDQCPTCDGEGYTVGEWPSAVVREHALGITAWASTLVAREPSTRDGIQARNERLASARAEAERWKATAETRPKLRLTPA